MVWSSDHACTCHECPMKLASTCVTDAAIDAAASITHVRVEDACDGQCMDQAAASTILLYEHTAVMHA